MIYTQIAAFFLGKVRGNPSELDHVWSCHMSFKLRIPVVIFFPSCNPAAVVRVQIHACHDLLMISAHGSMSRALALAGGWHQISSAAGGVLKTTNTSGGLEFSKDHQKYPKVREPHILWSLKVARKLCNSKMPWLSCILFPWSISRMSLKHPEINGGRGHWTWIRNMFAMFSSKSGNPETYTHAFIVFFRRGPKMAQALLWHSKSRCGTEV